ncbi:MAG: hypothetical protein NC121_07095 [Blautia sp.]|nr:hypothetical protein [Blautia sp.]
MIAGQYKEFKFSIKYGRLYLQCLERQICLNEMTLQSVSEIDRNETPSLLNMLFRGYILSGIFGWLGMIAGTSTAKRKTIYKVKLTFIDGRQGIAEVDDKIYEALLDIILNAQTI